MRLERRRRTERSGERWRPVGLCGVLAVSIGLVSGCEILAGVEDGILATRPEPQGGATTTSHSGGGPLGGGGAGNGGGVGAGGTTSSGGSGAAAGGSGAQGGQGGEGGSSPSYAEVILADTPVAYWRLGEEIGPTAVDSGPNGYDGTYLGSTITYGVTGAIVGDSDTAVYFAGTSLGRVEMGDILAFDGRAAFSIEAWVRPDEADGAVMSRCAYDATEGYQGYGLVIPGSPAVFRFRRNNTSANATIESFTEYAHLVGAYDGFVIRLYVNGTLAQATDSMEDLATLSVDFLLGEMDNWGRYEGDMDEVAVYDYSLSPTQIGSHYQAGRARFAGR